MKKFCVLLVVGLILNCSLVFSQEDSTEVNQTQKIESLTPSSTETDSLLEKTNTNIQENKKESIETKSISQDDSKDKNSADKISATDSKEAENKDLSKDPEEKDLSSNLEEELEEQEEEGEINYRKGIGLRYRVGWGISKLSSNQEYFGTENSIEDRPVITNMSYSVDSDSYLGYANFFVSVAYRPFNLPLDFGLSFKMERFKESYPLYKRGSLQVESDLDAPVRIKSRDTEYDNASYDLKTNMKKISLDFMYSFPEFVVVPYIALNIYPWYHTSVKGFDISWSDKIQNSGSSTVDSSIGYGCSLGAAYNVLERMEVFVELSFERTTSKLSFNSSKTDDNGSTSTFKEKIELDHKITKLLIGVGSSI